MPPPLQSFIENQLVALGNAPTAVSRPATSPPYPPDSMLFEFDYRPAEGGWHHIAVFFRYGQDESKLYVIAIGHMKLA